MKVKVAFTAKISSPSGDEEKGQCKMKGSFQQLLQPDNSFVTFCAVRCALSSTKRANRYATRITG
jgi:hypothetical protein